MEILDFTPDMQSEISEFVKECLADSKIIFEPGGRHASVSDIQGNYMRTGICKCLFVDGEIVGTIAVKHLSSDLCELKLFYVRPAMQSMGFGNLLLKTALECALSRGYKKMRLDTLHKHQKAHSLYKKHGFYNIARYNENIYAEIFMEKNLTEDN